MRRSLYVLLFILCILMHPHRATAETCQYDTKWGVVTITTSGSNVTGSYPYKDGKLQGTANYPNISGVWSQSNGTGNFSFDLHNGGLSGTWTKNGVAGKFRFNLFNGGFNGEWSQRAGTEKFNFDLYGGGFNGKWNYAGENSWRGSWNGKLIGCYN